MDLYDFFLRKTVMLCHIRKIRSHLPAIKHRNLDHGWRRDLDAAHGGQDLLKFFCQC